MFFFGAHRFFCFADAISLPRSSSMLSSDDGQAGSPSFTKGLQHGSSPNATPTTSASPHHVPLKRRASQDRLNRDRLPSHDSSLRVRAPSPRAPCEGDSQNATQPPACIWGCFLNVFAEVPFGRGLPMRTQDVIISSKLSKCKAIGHRDNGKERGKKQRAKRGYIKNHIPKWTKSQEFVIVRGTRPWD